MGYLAYKTDAEREGEGRREREREGRERGREGGGRECVYLVRILCTLS